jgi:hypothetical protein
MCRCSETRMLPLGFWCHTLRMRGPPVVRIVVEVRGMVVMSI